MNKIGSISDFKNHVQRRSHVSFDLFDTLLRRKYLKVNEVHDTVSAYALTQIGKRRTGNPFDLTLLRYRMSDALKTSGANGSQEPLIDAVWERILQRDIRDAAKRADVVQRIVSFEFNLELANLALVSGVRELLTALRAQGKTLIAISDMYFDLSKMKEILRKLEILDLFDSVYVSADKGLTKQTGDLFRYVLKDLSLSPSQIIHVGDSVKSDVKQATEAGISAVLVEQHDLLSLERPLYGQRARVEEEVADLVKVHLFSLMLDAQSQAYDHIFFMARDGCAIGDFLGRWKSQIVSRFMSPPSFSDLYLNRILSCWGGIDFSGDWLPQAVGLVFWLHHGEATAEEICGMLGVGKCPALGAGVLRANRDTDFVVRALIDADLKNIIKSSIIDKRAQLERHLRELGFFEYKAVAFSDVGYSGTVLRDINNLFLHRAAEEDGIHPPKMDLHLLAANDHFFVNRPRAYPFVEFVQPALPADKLPQELKASFAWLEFFFKHPTLQPILRFVESDGQITPELRHDDAPADPVPSERVADFALERDEDIVLLWMAAINFTGQLIDPIVHRFANPDLATIDQMRDEVFEKHSVQGARRSILLTVPGARVEDLTLAAQEGDYWIPGSIAASQAVAPVERPEGVRKANSPPSGIRAWLRWPKPAERYSLRPDEPFDPRFYRDFYTDLRQFDSDDQLRGHYARHGRQEKRFPTREALLVQLEREFGPVPPDFDGAAYLRHNTDLATHLDTPVQALNHYMRQGRHEGRRYLNFNSELPDAFERLRANGAVTLTDDEAYRWRKGHSTLTLFLDRHGVHAGSWMDDLDVAEFRALHYDWCGPVDSMAACIVALLESGMHRCPSLSLRTPFDETFYRSHSPALADLPAKALYQHYLNHASAEGFAPSEHAALIRLWGHSEFPPSFDWAAYRLQEGARLRSAAKVEVFRAFLDAQGIDRIKFVRGDGASELLEFMAVRAWRHHGRTEEARTLFLASIDAGGSSGRVQHMLGDLALQMGQREQALGHFREGAASTNPNLWSSFHVARLLLEQGDHQSALAALSASATLWQERAPWRRLWDRAMQDKSRAVLQNITKGTNREQSLEDADALVQEIDARLPSSKSFPNAGHGILVITARPLGATTKAKIASQGITVRNLGDVADGDFLSDLLSARQIILHEQPFTYEVLRAIRTAKSLDKRVTAWLGNLCDWEELPLGQSLSTEAGREPSHLRMGNLVEFGLPARYCDDVVTTLVGCETSLRKLAPATVINVVAQRRDNLRGSHHGKTVVLIAPLQRDDAKLIGTVVEALRLAAAEDSRLYFLMDPRCVERHEILSLAGRWEAVEANPDLPQLAELMRTADVVVHMADEEQSSYSVAAEGAALGVATVAVAATNSPGTGGADKGVKTPRETLTSPELADAIRRAAARDVVPTNGSRRLESELERRADTPAHRAPSRRDRKRILFVNVFFAPQVIGGATRVLKDNIDYFLDHHHGEFEFAVFTADEQNEHVNEWRLDSYRGMPVFRIATPQEINMDWRAVNIAVSNRFRDVLAAFQPDLVHIHCLQRLSAAVADVCRNTGVPYIVTLHDAWWISDFPFLSDEVGLPADARFDYYDQKRLRGVTVFESVARAEQLRRALLHADRRLAVSKSFGAIYEACGVPCETIENGVSRIAKAVRSNVSKHVELCHVGGLQHHKGAYLIEAALRRGSYTNLRFTIVDLARGPGEETHTFWGATPVTITGKMSTAELARFYARMNVLLAPSTWPESYGLVTREALEHGLWVVAGDRGAMADPVVPGENGFVVSVEDAGGIAEVLSTIDRNPAVYRVPPQAPRQLRASDDQSRELIKVYRSFAGRDGFIVMDGRQST